MLTVQELASNFFLLTHRVRDPNLPFAKEYLSRFFLLTTSFEELKIKEIDISALKGLLESIPECEKRKR